MRQLLQISKNELQSLDCYFNLGIPAKYGTEKRRRINKRLANFHEEIDSRAPDYAEAFLGDEKSEINHHRLGYCWSPSKCVIVAPALDEQIYTLYDTPSPREDSFSYLGIPIKPGGFIDVSALVHDNTTNAKKSMDQIATIGVNAKGFNHLLSIRFYVQLIRSQMEYGLAISTSSLTHLKKLEACQTECIRRIFGGSRRSSTEVMLHLVQQPSMTDRARILQTEFLIHSLQLPDDTLLQRLLPHIKTSASLSTWYKLTANPLWKDCFPVLDVLDRPIFNKLKPQFLEDSYEALCAGPNSKLISTCRPDMIEIPFCICQWQILNLVKSFAVALDGSLVVYPALA
ncbi:hypothetical protein [Parasitella parasitica]|uniref:Uncharacterized protein n=1 Tax=Parasitella parasitica TaxID=35722 RepID=A0A0B7NGI2_9FUNG|nr:hypothetical protein [Parasitella parasitica]